MTISCIMVTANRRRFVAGAVAAWQAQTFNPAERELIVVDDGDIRVRDLVATAVSAAPERGRIRYVTRPEGKDARSIGTLRNVACDLAAGEWIAHWDDDDINGPGRLEHQLGLALGTIPPHLRPTERATPGVADLTGYFEMVFHDTMRHRLFRFCYEDGAELMGTSLFYKRSLWKVVPFNQGIACGEDTDFIMRAIDIDAKVVRGLSYELFGNPARWEFYQAARHHTASTAMVLFAGEGWEPLDVEEDPFAKAALEFCGGKL